ncbi:MAG: nucleotide exchange factor GrpE [Longimicrobiales bacterium]
MDRDERARPRVAPSDADRTADTRADRGIGEQAVDPAQDTVTGEDIESDLEDLRVDLAKANDRHLRLAAEFDNYRKRIDRERSETYARAQAELAQRLLDALDDLERVADYGENTPVASLLEGVQLVEKKLHTALTSLGLEPIDPAGSLFDPVSMEALATVEAEHPEEDGVVYDVFQKGYRFKDQLIRPARVRVKKYEG